MVKFDDLKYLIRGTPDKSKNVYKRDLLKHKKTVESIKKYNHNFSETAFCAWIYNMLLRYLELKSFEDKKEKLKQFESIHLSTDTEINWPKDTNFYREYKKISSKFVDFTNYVHTSDTDVVSIRVCVTCSYDVENSSIDENDVYYFDIDMIKSNKEDSSKLDGKSYTSNCPSCGAPTNIVTFGICDHCKELVSIYDNVWKIRNIKVVF